MLNGCRGAAQSGARWSMAAISVRSVVSDTLGRRPRPSDGLQSVTVRPTQCSVKVVRGALTLARDP
jgi:hypothetical protein